jgi:NADP-dependent 3-hydroxy acid dehydrogenase YdfG
MEPQVHTRIAAITGHTAGIGLAISGQLMQAGYQIKGFSRSNGFDISQPGVIKKIVSESLCADVFINNAYHDFAQCELLEQLFRFWKHSRKKTIVNINSRAKYGVGKAQFYGQTKKELFVKAEKMMFSGKLCRIININPGYVETDMVAEVHHKYNMLSPQQLAEMVVWCINQPQSVEIGELSVWTTTLT